MTKRYTYRAVLRRLQQEAQSGYVKTIEGFGIPPGNILGIKTPKLRELARSIGTDHELAIKLWNSNIYEARLLASYIAEPGKMNDKQAEKWVRETDSWAICDSLCIVFARTEGSYERAKRWTTRNEEFVKRAGFVTMACLTIHDKKAMDEDIESFFPYIISESWDERKYVKKGINWTLRQIGKRNLHLNEKAIETAHKIKNQGTGSAKWIATDALRELTSKAVIDRLHNKARNVSSDF